MNILHYGLYTAVILTLLFSMYYSVKRRRADSHKSSGLYSARMNICMGSMLVFIALIQILLFEETTVRIIVGSVFLLLGLFNVFAGIRNHTIYSRM